MVKVIRIKKTHKRDCKNAWGWYDHMKKTVTLHMDQLEKSCDGDEKMLRDLTQLTLLHEQCHHHAYKVKTRISHFVCDLFAWNRFLKLHGRLPHMQMRDWFGRNMYRIQQEVA